MEQLKHLSVIRGDINYTDMFVGRYIYYGYVVISIVLVIVMLAPELFDIAILYSFIGCYFEKLSLSPLQVCGVSLTRFKEFR